MPEITLDEAKKELKGIVEKAKTTEQLQKEKLLSEEAKKDLETKKAEDLKKQEEEKKLAEEKAAKDKEILSKKDEELKDEDKTRKAELLKEEEAKLSIDEKIKRVKEQSQKRMDEIVSELKDTKYKSEKETAALKEELAKLRTEKTELEAKLNPPKDEDLIIEEIEKEYQEVIKKNLEEDKSKPVEQRREMSQEDWDNWYVENPRAATAWESRQELRRSNEKQRLGYKKITEKQTKDFVKQIEESTKKTLAKHPELDISKRQEELKAQGKSAEEIKEIIFNENPKIKICAEIIKENPDYNRKPNGPELVVAEMEKRLAKETSKEKDNSEVTELKERLKKLEDALETALADKEARESLDEGVNSTSQRGTHKEVPLTDMEKDLISTMQANRAPQASIDSALKKLRDRNKKK